MISSRITVTCTTVMFLASLSVSHNDQKINNEEFENNTREVSPEQIFLWKQNAVRKCVGIIGGGVAGIGALKTLLDHGFDDVILLEAQDKLGGRIDTFREGSIHLEDGAEWIHGGRRNVVYRIAQQLLQIRETVESENEDDRILREDGSSDHEDVSTGHKVDAILEDAMENGVLHQHYDGGYGQYFIRRFEEDISHGEKSEVLNAWLHYMEQTVNGDEGTDDWNNISARDADFWIDFGEDQKWKNGYDTFVTYLSKSFASRHYLLGTPVKYIYWQLDDTNKVLLVTEDNKSFLVDQLVMTISVGCIKHTQDSLFFPPIPNPLRTALKGIVLGGSNKLFMGWPERWWEEATLDISILWTKFDLPPSMNWLYGIVSIYSMEENETILQAFVSGEYSRKMEELSEETVQHDFRFLLERILRRKIPEHNLFRRTKWNSNRWTCGSYGSFITPEGNKAGLHSRAPFREPLKNESGKPVVHWAGEHTHDTRYGTVDGAFMTGIREAKRILSKCAKQTELI